MESLRRLAIFIYIYIHLSIYLSIYLTLSLTLSLQAHTAPCTAGGGGGARRPRALPRTHPCARPESFRLFPSSFRVFPSNFLRIMPIRLMAVMASVRLGRKDHVEMTRKDGSERLVPDSSPANGVSGHVTRASSGACPLSLSLLRSLTSSLAILFFSVPSSLRFSSPFLHLPPLRPFQLMCVCVSCSPASPVGVSLSPLASRVQRKSTCRGCGTRILSLLLSLSPSLSLLLSLSLSLPLFLCLSLSPSLSLSLSYTQRYARSFGPCTHSQVW